MADPEAARPRASTGLNPRRTIPGPLTGLTVIDLSWHLAGPYCTLILADLGARVIKVEAPGSNAGYDPGGLVRHYYKGQDAHYMALNRNKESITLDLKNPTGVKVFLDLIRTADVCFNNFRPGVMKRLGIDYEALRAVNPNLVYAALSAFGQDGPYAARPGVDLIAQAIAGGMSMTGERGRGPARMGLPVADLAGGMFMTIAILAALRARDAGLQPSTEIDVSLLDGQIAMVPYFAAYYFLDGAVPGPQGSGGHSPSYAAFRCKDEKYIVIAVYDQVKWRRLADEVLGHPEWVADERFQDPRSRVQYQDELGAMIGEVIAERTSDEWLGVLQAADLLSARVNNLAEALADPQVVHRDMVIELEHQLGDPLKFVGNPIKMSGFPTEYTSPPIIGGDTAAVLGELLHLDADDLERLRADGVTAAPVRPAEPAQEVEDDV
jgi:crotonobetainyl-CoA:carnitine CoA-transferase CaiB-like acyl-CoA transferase